MKTSMIAVLPDGREFVKDMIVDRRLDRSTCESIAREAFYNLEVSTHRSNPQTMAVEILRCEVEKGQVVRKREGAFNVAVPIAPWTEDEALKEIEDILGTLPEEFRGYVSTEAYDRGSGYDEIVSYARSIAGDLAPIIAKYTARIKGKKPL